jgi:hypothetical protein
MNERIQELMRQATEYKSNNDDTDTYSFVLNLEKFAELIARDFAHYVDLMYGCPHGDFYAIEYVDSYFKENENVHKP